MPLRNAEVWENGVLISTYQVDVSDEAIRRETLDGRVRTALITNAIYLAQPAIPATPTLAQLTAAVRIIRDQVDALTRQNNAIIRLNLQLLDEIGDT